MNDCIINNKGFYLLGSRMNEIIQQERLGVAASYKEP